MLVRSTYAPSEISAQRSNSSRGRTRERETGRRVAVGQRNLKTRGRTRIALRQSADLTIDLRAVQRSLGVRDSTLQAFKPPNRWLSTNDTERNRMATPDNYACFRPNGGRRWMSADLLMVRAPGIEPGT